MRHALASRMLIAQLTALSDYLPQERGFIKAETVAFKDFKQLCGGKPSMAGVKDAGKYRQEGKTYVVQDGDIFNFQFNVTAKKK